MNILLTGGRGMVGGRMLPLLSSHSVLAPSSTELNIVKTKEVEEYLATHRPDVLIHAGAFTDLSAAERERGDTGGQCWQVNVVGTKNLVGAAKTVGSFLIYLSTGSVFGGRPGPFRETDVPGDDSVLSWYGVTKKYAETFCSTVVRISHPLGGQSNKPDYLEKLLTLYRTESLYPLFPDQYFALTSIPDLVVALERILLSQRTGVFHAVSRNATTPLALLQRASGDRTLPTLRFADFLAAQANPLRFTQDVTLDGTNTRRQLGLPERSWEEIVDKIVMSG